MKFNQTLSMSVILALAVASGISAFSHEEEFIQWEDPTFGGLKPLPEYSRGQRVSIDLLSQELNQLHEDLGKKLNFLAQKKEIVDGRFVRIFQAREQYSFPIRERFVVNHRVIMEVRGGGTEYAIESIEFYTRRSRTNKEYDHPYTQIMRMQFKIGDNLENLQISIRKLDPSGAREDRLTISEIYDPQLRVNIARAYKNRIIELINDLDLQIAGLGNYRDRRIRFIRQEMDSASGSQQN